MFVEYFYWHYVQSPLWLLKFFETLQQALTHYFSVNVMLRTLVAPWRKDQLRYGSGVGSLFTVFALNMISRGIGFLIRSIILIIWAVTEILFFTMAALFFIAFLLWPLLTIFSVSAGLGLLVNSL